MNLDSVEESIQNLLSELYPPYEATAPVLLSQLFQIIGGRYQRDALRCFLDFLVPAKHILDTVQQAACAQYSDVLFLCEGWPLCLHDQVVVHLAPINPSLLQPGDFYLQVEPFCRQSARIVVCSLLEEEGLSVHVAEETPIPETSYPCMFRRDWLNELNQDRRGTPLGQCLVATEQGLVRLPWARVAVPDFVPRSAESSMASAPQAYSLPPPLPVPPPLPDFPDNSSAGSSFPRSLKKTLPEDCPAAVQNSASASSSPPSAFSVETRVCPAKHGIAVSLCLVDARTASSSRLVRVKGTEAERKPIGWVSPSTWDSRFSGTKINTVPDKCSPSNLPESKTESKGVTVSESTLQDKETETNKHNMSKYEPTDNAVVSGEYIDILQAKMLFGKDQCQEQPNVLTQSYLQIEAQTQKYPHKTGQPVTQIPLCTQSQPYVELQTKPPSVSRSNMSEGAGLHRHSQTQHPDYLEPPQCLRTVRFAEKPCTPCMARRQGGKVVRAQELRCRYRDSYQAAIKNPVAFETERFRGSTLAAVNEDGDLSQCGDRREPPRTETGDPRSDIQETGCETGNQTQSPPSVTGDICKESGERNIVPQRKLEHVNTSSCMENSIINTLHDSSDWTCWNAQSAQSYGNFHNSLSPESRINTTNSPKHPDSSIKHHELPYSSNEMSGLNMNTTRSTGMSPNIRSLTASQNRQESNKRSSSLSTAVVDTSEKCELVIVEGQNVRRKENTNVCAEIPQLHVVKCKNSTAFGLVSPKINRRKNVVPADEQPGPTSVTSANSRQREKPSQTDSSAKTETQKLGRPRPDHLPLGSPDPKEHPLYLGVASLTGCKDRMGRAIVELYGDHPGWRSTVTSQELFQMLLYFYSVTRKEIREAGMMLIFDARRRNPQPQLYKALMALQEQCPCAVRSLVLLIDKENNHQPERCPGIQTDLVTSIKALFKLVEVNQLSSCFGGSSYGLCDWMTLHQRLFPFFIDLHEASCLLLRAISKLEEPQMTDSVQAVQQCMMDQKTLMRDMLEDSRLVRLQREGGAILARLRKESDLKYPHCEDLSDAVDSVSSLYNHVEEQGHVLVQRTNTSLEHLEYLLQLREMEGLFYQIQQWFDAEGERHLQEAASVKSSGDRMEQVLNSFNGFLIEANDRRHHAMALVSEAERLQRSGLSHPETEAFVGFVCTFKLSLEDFLCRAEACGHELQIMVNMCDFCEQAVELAGECTDYLTQSQSRALTIQDPGSASQVNQANTLIEQIKEPCLNPSPRCQSDAAHGSGSTTTRVSLAPPDRIILQSFQERFLRFSPERFQEIKTQASTLPDSRGIQIWNDAYRRCQEAQQLLQERMQELDEVCHQQAGSSSCCEGRYVDVMSTNVQTASPGGQKLLVQSTPGLRHPQWEGVVSGAVDLEKRRPILDSRTPRSTTVACCNIIIKPEDSSDAGTSRESKVTPQSPHRSSRKPDGEARRRQTSRARSERDAAALSQAHTVGCQWFPWRRGPVARSVSEDSCTSRVATTGSSPPEQQTRPPSSCSRHSQPSARILQEAQKFQISRHGSFCSEEESCTSDRWVAGGNGTVCCKHSSLPSERYGGVFYLSSPQENTSSALRLQRVMEELVFTEREYVRSLGYILTHYLPLMDRLDIPQDLRGKRGVIFGNLEKLYDFHSHYFLPELEACERQPGMVARCFLRHSGSFGLYALYSKNKPQSDALILHRRHDIFKKKQQELGDMMDLSSYLLRPIQRISKYSLLLLDMLALVCTHRPRDGTRDTVSPFGVCGHGPAAHVPDLTDFERDRERADIQSAADLIQFQMRHGNDLLTMDAIQDCDINLKEQGQLIRQDEFTVFFRKKKCVRRVFLFEQLVLFSKPKRTNVGNDVYVHKQSFKTNDIGMTQNSSMSSLCFEIWIRRRKNEDTFTLKASSLEVKKAWTSDLERILWDQAAHSRELRLQERVLMGMSREPFMDIQHSDAAICDRAVGCVLPGRMPVACCSHRGLEYPRPRSIGSGSTASTTLSQSSSSSGRGSLPPAGYPGHPSYGLDTNVMLCSSPEAATDNDLNSRHLHQHHLHPHCDQWKTRCPLMNSPELAEDRTNLAEFSGEIMDNSNVGSHSSELKPAALCRTPSLRKNDSPAVTSNKPGVPPKPPHLEKAQGKSTEV